MPVLVHLPVLIVPETDPARRIESWFTHTTWSLPALTIVAESMVISIVSDLKQAKVVDRYNDTLPALMSAALGTWLADKEVSFGAKIPVPEAVHIPVPLGPVTFPVSITVGL